jgi:transcriptional pleiotropic regulator of transition state genes
MKSKIVDRLGRIVIPIDYRRKLGLGEGSEIDISCEDKKLIITATENACRLCGAKLTEEYEIPLCKSCIDMVKKTK